VGDLRHGNHHPRKSTMKRSPVALAIVALLAVSSPSRAQFLFSTGPLPFFGVRATVVAPIVSGASVRGFGYSGRVYGASYDAGTSGTSGYVYRASHPRLRRASWIFQPQTQVNPRSQDNPTPSPRPAPSADTTTSFVVRYANESAIADAIDEARQWAPKKPVTPVKLTGKPQLWILQPTPQTQEVAKLVLATQQYLTEHGYPRAKVITAGTSADKDLPDSVAKAFGDVGGPPALAITDANNKLLPDPIRLSGKTLDDIIQAINKVEGR
jgi:hypothetical protein